jgi:hypothetical protein
MKTACPSETSSLEIISLRTTFKIICDRCGLVHVAIHCVCDLECHNIKSEIQNSAVVVLEDIFRLTL